MAKKTKARDYLVNNVKKPLEVVIKRVLKKKPEDPIPLIISALEESQGITNDSLSNEERIELNELRNEYKKLKGRLEMLEESKIESVPEDSKSDHPAANNPDNDDTDSEDENESDDTLPPLPEAK